MPKKIHPARSSFKHYGRSITVEMVLPKVGLDGRANVSQNDLLYRIPFGKRGKVVDVIGVVARATFEVSGWRHPIRFETSTHPFVNTVIIQHIEIGKRGYLWSHEWQEVDLDGIPLGKIREHARRAATFVGKLKTRTSNTAGNPKVTSQHPFIRFRELDEPITDIKIGGELSAIDAAQFGSKYDPENNRSLLPMNNPKSLAEVARLYKQYYQIGRDAAGYLTVSKYIAREINRPATTCQQMISIARAQGLLPKQTKRKRGTK